MGGHGRSLMFGIDFQRALFSASRKDFTFWNENAAAEYDARAISSSDERITFGISSRDKKPPRAET